MQQFGYDLTRHTSKSLSALPEVEFDYVVTMGCGDACPHIPARNRDDWALADPRDMSPEDYRTVCLSIGERVRKLLISLGVPVTAIL